MHPNKPQLEPEVLEAQRKQREMKRAKIAADVAAQLRDPFQKLLVDLLDAQPSMETLEAFAAKYPNKWVTAIGVIGQMSGYTKDVHVTNLNVMQIGALPDSELLRRLEQAEQAQRIRMRERGLITMVPRETIDQAKQDYDPDQPNLSALSRSHPANPFPRSKADDDRTIDIDASFKRAQAPDEGDDVPPANDADDQV